MTVPSKYREVAPDGVVVSKGLDGNLMVRTISNFDQLAESLNSLSLTEPVARSCRRSVLGNSAEVTYDSAGRILIPLHLRKLAGIEENVMVIGMGDYFEIWDTARLEKFEASRDPDEEAEAWASLNITTTRGN